MYRRVAATFYPTDMSPAQCRAKAESWVADAVKRGIYDPENLDEQVEVSRFYHGYCVIEICSE